MQAYKTLSEAINDLIQRGYTRDFNIEFDKIKCRESGRCLNPGEFEIVEYYRFDGFTNPDDESALYAVASKDGTMKGLLVTAYGTYTDSISTAMLEKLRIHPK